MSDLNVLSDALADWVQRLDAIQQEMKNTLPSNMQSAITNVAYCRAQIRNLQHLVANMEPSES